MTNEAKKKQLPAFLVLTIISLVAALVLAATNEVTKGPIAEHAAQERNRAFAAVLPADSYTDVAIPEGHANVTGLYEAKNEAGEVIGHTVVAAVNGYAGPVAVTLGVGNDGMVTGVVIGDTSFAETAGFGMRWKEETDRWEQFKQIDTANGGSIEAITGATVTSNAVLSATNAGVNCVNEVRGVEARDVVTKGTPAAPVVEQAALEGGIHEGSAPGYQSDVRVQLTMDDAGVITGLNIDSMGETMGLGSRATTEAAFAEQFVGKTAPFTLGDGIDGLTGATVTSKAVVEAVNAACAAPVNPDAVPFDLGGGEEEEPAVETSAEPAPAGALTATAPGYGGDVGVTITLNEDGTIATLEIDVSNQVPPICNNVLTDDFMGQFIGKKGPFVKGENVDIVTGATFTSDGVIAAVNSLLPTEEAPAEEPVVEEVPAEEPVVEEPAAEAAPAAEALTATAPGYGGDVGVSITLNEDGTIATLEIDVSNQVPPICNNVLTDDFMGQFIGKQGPFVKGENVDIVTGATFTSDGVIAAVNSLLPTEEAPAEEPAADEPVNDMAVTGEEGPVAPAAVTVTVPGYAGLDVVVTVTFAEDGTVAELVVDASTQSPGLGKKCAEEEFTSQFIGGTAPFTREGIDVVSYATITSEAVIDAVNQAAETK